MPERTYCLWLLHQLDRALIGEAVEGHGPFEMIGQHYTADGVTAVVCDKSNGQEYDIVIRAKSQTEARKG